MNKLVKIAAFAAVALTITGCAVRPTAGIIYSETQVPVTATSSSKATVIKGTSDKCTSILGLIATGNCGVESAKANSGINTVTSVDYKVTTILGLISTGTTVITGTQIIP